MVKKTAYAAEGDVVTVSSAANAGYKAEGALTVTKAADGSAVEVADNTFTMPAETVTVSQNFVNVAKNVTVSLQTITTGLGDRIAMPITVTGDIAALCVTKLTLKVSYISVRGIFSVTPKATFYSFAVWYTLFKIRLQQSKKTFLICNNILKI